MFETLEKKAEPSALVARLALANTIGFSLLVGMGTEHLLRVPAARGSSDQWLSLTFYGSLALLATAQLFRFINRKASQAVSEN
jgi:hypothetical protein